MLSTLIRQVSLSQRILDINVNNISLPKAQRNIHIQFCVRSELQCLQLDVYYYCKCFNWIIGEEWEPLITPRYDRI
jgi:hypothetical protein